VSLYAIRTFFLFVFFFAYYRPRTEKVDPKSLNIVGLSGLLGAVFMVLKYYGYQEFGIPFTALVSVAAPITVYVGSARVLRERQKGKVLIATGIIAVAIVYATSVMFH
jgi:drug/metabolite transporter (DMT)-like permease